MKRVPKSTAPAAGVLVLLDLLAGALAITPGLFAWTVAAVHLWRAAGSRYFVAHIAVTPLLVLTAFIVAVFVLRVLTPRMRAGVFPVGLNLGVLGWYSARALSRSASVAGLETIIQSTYLTRFLYFRALGGNIAFRVNAARDFSLMDVPMLTIGKDCSLAYGVRISAHTFSGDRLIIAPVTIGENVFLGMDVVIGPDSKIGSGSWLGVGTKVFRNEIAPGTHIDNFAWAEGQPKS